MASTSPGCAGSDSGIPARDGPLRLELRYPNDGTRLTQDSIALWGTTGTGNARLEVNGRRIRVEANGAFADIVVLPAGDSIELEFVAQSAGATDRKTVWILRGAPPAGEPEDALPWTGWVRLSRVYSDTVDSATQARPIFTRWSPGGGVALPIEQGIRLQADRRTRSAFRLRLDPALYVWAAASEVDTMAADRSPILALQDFRIHSDPDQATVSMRVSEPVPTSSEAVPGGLVWTIHGGSLTAADLAAVPDALSDSSFVRQATVEQIEPGRVRVTIMLEHDPLGWKTEWQDGTLAFTIRTPRPLSRGLAGLIVALDPGHPPFGTTGADGLHEDSMTLAVARAAADRLRSLGARPFLTRVDAGPVSLDERIVRAHAAGTHVFVSIHGNSPGPGRAPQNVNGTAVYWLQPNAFTLARALLAPVASALDQPELYVLREDLAVLRATWYPAVVVEGIGLVLPEREAYLRTPQGVAAYADGIVAGLTEWLARSNR